MAEELHHAWQRFRDDDDAFVLVITGAGDDDLLRGLGPRTTPPSSTSWATTTTSARSSTLDPGACGYTRRVDVFKPVIAAVNGYAFAAGLETALLADIRIAAENAEFGALERRWNIVGGDGMTVAAAAGGRATRSAMELIITGRRIDAARRERIGLVNEVVPEGKALERAQELAHEIAALPQGAIRSDKESVMRGVGRTLEERLRHRGRADALDVHAPRLRTRSARPRSSSAASPNGRTTASSSRTFSQTSLRSRRPRVTSRGGEGHHRPMSTGLQAAPGLH